MPQPQYTPEQVNAINQIRQQQLLQTLQQQAVLQQQAQQQQSQQDVSATVSPAKRTVSSNDFSAYGTVFGGEIIPGIGKQKSAYEDLFESGD